MCGGSQTKFLGHDVSVYMGYHGGSITIGDKFYSAVKKDSPNEISAGEMIELLSKYSSKELANLIVDLIDNADE